jgi:acyl homoserine lactone synthase
MLRFRHRVFVERLHWEAPTEWDGMEFDRYDTPAATYCVCRDDGGEVIGSIRLKPTTLPYMIGDVWPHLVNRMDVPKSPHVWEASRLGVDRRLSPAQRSKVLDQLILAYMEAGLMVGAKQLIAIMPVKFWSKVFHKRGWPTTPVGPEEIIDGKPCVVATFDVSYELLASIRRTVGIHSRVLVTADDLAYGVAAE